MCSPAAAVGGGQMAIGLLGSYMAYQNARKQADDANKLKDENDARLKNKLVVDMGQGAQQVADLNKQEQQVGDIEEQSKIQAQLDFIRAEGKLNVAELQEGQSTELVKGQMEREALQTQDVIKDNAGIDKLNIAYQHRNVATALDMKKLSTIDAIASTNYTPPPMKEMYALQGLTGVASGFQTYYSMPESSREDFNWDFSFASKDKPKKSTNKPTSYYNPNYNPDMLVS
jgi:hypothetical protein